MPSYAIPDTDTTGRNTRREQPGHGKPGSFLDHRRHLDLDAPAPWQLDRAARAAVDLAQAHSDWRLDVQWDRSGACPRRVPEDRAEDVPKPAALAEEVFHLFRRNRSVLGIGPARRCPETAAWAPPPAVRLHTGLRGRSPFRAELVV